MREGRITEAQAQGHPMRNFVECCIGGDPVLPEMTLSGRRALQPGDVLLLCSDGLWSGAARRADRPSRSALANRSADAARRRCSRLGERAVSNSAPYADNTSAAAIRWLGP